MSRLWQARFYTTVNHLRDLPKLDVPEIAFAGRSNAGKSTAINVLCNQKSLAHASRTPGRTQHINYFSIGGAHIAQQTPRASREHPADRRKRRLPTGALQSAQAIRLLKAAAPFSILVQPRETLAVPSVGQHIQRIVQSAPPWRRALKPQQTVVFPERERYGPSAAAVCTARAALAAEGVIEIRRQIVVSNRHETRPFAFFSAIS